MRNSVATALVLAGLLGLALPAGCSSGGQERQDPQGRITFVVPADWAEAPGSSGTRFKPPGPDGNAAHIQINTVERDARVTLEGERDAWLGQMERLGEEVLRSGTREVPSFEAVEYAHTVETIAGDGVQHFVRMKREGYHVSAWLMATTATYEKYLPAFEAVVDSVRPVSPD